MTKNDSEILKEAMSGGPPPVHVAKLPPLQERCNKEQLLETIQKYRGCTTYICSVLDCSYGQLMKAVEKWHLEDALKAAREQLIDEAEQVLLGAMRGDDPKLAVDAAKFVLSKNRKAAREWATGGNVNLEVKSGAPVQINTIFGIPASEDVG